MQESEIIEMLRKQSPDGAAALMSHYGPLMKYVIRPIVANEQDREECLSEAVMRILDKIHLYDEDRGSWTAWITSVTRSVALNKRRSNKVPYEEAAITDQTPSPDPTLEELILHQERRRELKDALSQLSQKDRVISYAPDFE